MKAPDIVESWMWKHGEEIIERLLSRSSRTIAQPAHQTPQPMPATTKDRYSVIARRYRLRQALKRVRQGAR